MPVVIHSTVRQAMAVAGRIWMAGAPLAADVVEESWVSFGQQNVLGWMMGQVLLPAAQAGKVAGRLARQGLEVTGIVDPLPGSTPPITLIRFRGMGDATTLAGELKQALGALLRPAPNPNPDTGRLDAAKIERVLGRRGEADSGALVFRIARAEHVKCCGLENDPLLVFSGLPLGPATGMESRFAFEAVGARAVAVGRLAVRRAEAGPVERALSIFGLDTVALAELLPDEEPRIFFLYFFGRGNPLELAQGLRAAVERMNPLPPVNKP